MEATSKIELLNFNDSVRCESQIVGWAEPAQTA